MSETNKYGGEARCPQCGSGNLSVLGMCRKCEDCGKFGHLAEFMPALTPIKLAKPDYSGLSEKQIFESR